MFLSTYCLLSTALGTQDIVVNDSERFLYLYGLLLIFEGIGGTDNKCENKKMISDSDKSCEKKKRKGKNSRQWGGPL